MIIVMIGKTLKGVSVVVPNEDGALVGSAEDRARPRV